MAYFEYLFQDVLSRNILGSAPLTQVTFNDPVNTAGTFSGTYTLQVTGNANRDAAVAAFARQTFCPDQTLVHCIWPATNTIVATYLIVSITWDVTQNQIVLNGTQMSAWLHSIYPINIVTPLIYTNVDQLSIVQSLMNELQSSGAINGIPSIITDNKTSGVLTSLTITDIFSSDLNSIFTTLASNYGGFDWEVTGNWNQSDGLPQLYLYTYFPEKSSNLTSQELTLSFYATPYASNITTYTPFPLDASYRYQYILLTASTSSGQTYSTIWQDGRLGQTPLITPQIQGGELWGRDNQFTPLMRMTTQSVSLNDFSGTTLGNLAATMGESWSQSSGAPVITHHPLKPSISSYNVGDRCRLTIFDSYMGIDMFSVRVVDRAITDEDPSTVASVAVTLDLTDTNNPADSA